MRWNVILGMMVAVGSLAATEARAQRSRRKRSDRDSWPAGRGKEGHGQRRWNSFAEAQ